MERQLMLPGYHDFDQHYETANYVRIIPQYELHSESGKIEIDDSIWGKCTIGDWPGDEIFLELFLNPLVQRSAGVEQLTLPRHFSTMPNTTEFSRFEHAWGSVVFTRKMIEKMRKDGVDVGDRDALILQLRTFVSDLGHTAFSHLGDWLFQGFGGTEDQHDHELEQLLEAGKVNNILRKHNINPTEVIFPEVSDWIECSSPDLCVDRVDYGAREIYRWVEGYEPSETWLSRFSVNKDGQIIMSDENSALKFAAGFGLLATEHWGQPVHRLQLQLFGELIRSAVVDQANASYLTYDVGHPRDLLYVIDNTLNTSTRAVGDLNHNLFGAMLDIARAQRKIFSHGRKRDIEIFFSRLSVLEWNKVEGKKTRDENIHFPDPLVSMNWHSEYTGLRPANIEIIPAQSSDEIADFDRLPYTLDTFLEPLKPRVVDPLFYNEKGEVKRLSEGSELWRRLMTEQRAIQARGYVARLYADPAWIADLKHKIHIAKDAWQKQLQYQRITTERLGGLIRDEAMMAIGRAGTIHLR